MAAFNLIPIPPLDGAEAWPLFGILGKRLEKQRARSRRRREEAQQEPIELAVRRELVELELLEAAEREGAPVNVEVAALLERVRRSSAE